jgi:V8-like Glu-specific endopeptidase
MGERRDEMKGCTFCCRTWAGFAAGVLLLAAVGVVTGDRAIRAVGATDRGQVPIEQQGYRVGNVAGTDVDARQVDIHARLVAERPAGADERPLTIEVTDEERASLGVNEPGTRKLRIGTVKALNAHVRFDDLTPSALKGRRVREHGVLQGTDDGGLVWTASLRSEGATALQVRIDGFFLPPGAELWFYTTAGETHGPYTWAGPQATREFWTNSVSGSEAYLQLRMSGPVSQEDLRRLGFVIADVVHIDESILKRGSGPEAASSAGFCSYNASCVESGECVGPEWNDVRNAVARIRFNSGPFAYLCSGGLVADTGASGTPYFLTANHCISRSGEASSMEAFFQYRSTANCGSANNCGSPSSSVPRTLGATILSTSSTSDYTLLRLSQPAPTGSHFLGWTTASVATANNTQLFRFSHPAGAPQAYSAHVVDTSRPTCSSWPRGAWIYSSDVFGATEGGSSGSPVVNAQSKLVGQLSGACGFNVNDSCDKNANATVDGAFANYYNAVSQFLASSTNQPPTASFTYLCTELSCTFSGSGTDSDGTIASYAWNFGDGGSGTGANDMHTYAVAGTYNVTLTVTDDDGAMGTSTRSVTVSASEPPQGITLTATGFKEKGLQKVNLSWSGATSSSVDILRNGTRITTTANDGAHLDPINARGGGSYQYRVCEAGTSVCSANVTVTF